jgi:hypothetical protein
MDNICEATKPFAPVSRTWKLLPWDAMFANDILSRIVKKKLSSRVQVCLFGFSPTWTYNRRTQLLASLCFAMRSVGYDYGWDVTALEPITSNDGPKTRLVQKTRTSLCNVTLTSPKTRLVRKTRTSICYVTMTNPKTDCNVVTMTEHKQNPTTPKDGYRHYVFCM